MRAWPHSPSKIVTAPGTYLITAATYHKLPLFAGEERLNLLTDLLLTIVEEQNWTPLAWAVFANHYHLLGHTPDVSHAPKKLTDRLHIMSALELNKIDGAAGRKVWYQSWPTRITFEKSVMARMHYVHHNAVKHELVTRAEDYPWCSASWFLAKGDRPFVESVLSFKIDQLKIYDDF